jgi:adenylate cyclase class 2
MIRMIEVEAKFLVSDLAALERALQNLSQELAPVEFHQADEYFNHPCRDFGTTDEAFRLRNCNGRLDLTYKGPRLDAVTKTREELELAISDNAAESISVLRSILLALGFRSAGGVVKHRRSVIVHIDSTPVTVSIDNVTGLPTYAELEIICDAADRESATATMLRVAELLNLNQTERRSYLELLGCC